MRFGQPVECRNGKARAAHEDNTATLHSAASPLSLATGLAQVFQDPAGDHIALQT